MTSDGARIGRWFSAGHVIALVLARVQHLMMITSAERLTGGRLRVGEIAANIGGVAPAARNLTALMSE